MGNRVVTEVRESDSFEEVLDDVKVRTGEPIIDVYLKEKHIVRIRVSSITHYEVLSESEYKKEKDFCGLKNMMDHALR